MNPEELLDSLEFLCVRYTDLTLKVQTELLRSLKTNNTAFNTSILVELRGSHFLLVPVALRYFIEMMVEPVEKKSQLYKDTLRLYNSHLSILEHAKALYTKLLEANISGLTRLLDEHGVPPDKVDTKGEKLPINKRFPITIRKR